MIEEQATLEHLAAQEQRLTSTLEELNRAKGILAKLAPENAPSTGLGLTNSLLSSARLETSRAIDLLAVHVAKLLNK